MPVSQSPFVERWSFEQETPRGPSDEAPSRSRAASPFLAVYELDLERGIDPQAEEYVSFLNELYDQQLNETLSGLADEAAALHEASLTDAARDPRTDDYQSQRLLTQHFAPLVAEAETMIRAVAAEVSRRDPDRLGDDEIEMLVDGQRPSAPVNPQFEEWLGGFVKKVVSKGISLAKNAASAVAKAGLGQVLGRLETLIKPMVKNVVQLAIRRLPKDLQPIATMLRDKVPFLKELEDGAASPPRMPGSDGIAEIQHELNRGAANLLFAETETELELEVVHASGAPRALDANPVAEMELAREQFVDGLGQLREGEDPTPHLERFIPALLPVLKVGLKLAGRQRVVSFLASLLGKLIQKFVGPQYAPRLSKAIVDVGLRMLQLETSARDEARAAASAVASTVEETVRQVGTLPESVLDNQELLEGAALEAFERAAANNLPPVLSEEVYRTRPELREHRRGFWYRGGRRYKVRVGPKLVAAISPHQLASLETFAGQTVGEVLEEQYAIPPGEELEAEVHLYEAMPGMRLSDIARGEEVIARQNGEDGTQQLHPLTRAAAALLLDQPELGRDAEEGETGDPTAPQPGQRFYYLEIPGKGPLMAPPVHGRAHARRRSRTQIILHFPKNTIVARVFLSEVRAQKIAVKLRQKAHIGTLVARLQRFLRAGVNRAFAANLGLLKIVHGAVIPGRPVDALNRLPALVARALRERVTDWLLKALVDHLQKQPQELIKAAEDTADGVTLNVALENPPGLRELGEALKGKAGPLAILKLPEGQPTVRVQVYPGHQRG